jgi:enamine deaminase RidA (YjgF/YER057c/UK114 family)
MTISEDVTEQADQTFRNIKAAMEKAGFSLADVVRVTYIFPNGADFEPCWPVFRKYLGETRPAATAVVAQLIDPRMKIEIEVTGKKR